MQNTTIGIETSDEMCWATFSGFPGTSVVKCTGHIWTGTLTGPELGRSIGMRHPEAEAPLVLDGSIPTTGGFLLRKDGVDFARGGYCHDSPSALKRCGIIEKRVEQIVQSCTADLGEMSALMEGFSLLSLCCTRACEGYCKDHQVCLDRANANNSHGTGTETSGSVSVTTLPVRSVFVFGLFVVTLTLLY
mmetsp:Transcript_32682/g.71269  ORF Transcript_32682/g.71269 Transcript_32682/m.71269 type:complete len:190 (+) Transcript_32682:3-572(+)